MKLNCRNQRSHDVACEKSQNKAFSGILGVALTRLLESFTVSVHVRLDFESVGHKCAPSDGFIRVRGPIPAL